MLDHLHPAATDPRKRSNHRTPGVGERAEGSQHARL
jgi:hypothetical protein